MAFFFLAAIFALVLAVTHQPPSARSKIQTPARDARARAYPAWLEPWFWAPSPVFPPEAVLQVRPQHDRMRRDMGSALEAHHPALRDDT